MKWGKLLIFISFFVVIGCSKNDLEEEKVKLTISAAASLTDVMNEIKPMFEEENKDIEIIYNFGSSGALQQQIVQGAPVDVFISASQDKFSFLVKDGYVLKESAATLVGNDVVLIIPLNANYQVEDFQDLADPSIKKVAIGIPETVPAGFYAKEVLESLQLWHDIQDKLIFAKDVRQVLTYVESGNVDAGVVYSTDTVGSKKVQVIKHADESLHSPIVYPFGIISNSEHKDEANLFYEFMQKETIKEQFAKYGFKSANEKAANN
ncbi:molybdate ABC transporter substrate-binding protein [Bacillus timonensis]|nr:molybdate ABC transporter substrate-binding protein [Bacillus timonensis]